MSIENRLMRVEKQVRWWRWSSIACFVALVLVVFVGRSGDEESVDLVGRTLTLRTADGKSWLRARPSQSGGEVSINSTAESPAGLPGILLGVTEDRTLFTLFDDDFHPQIVIKVEDNRPSIRLTRDGVVMIAGIEEDLRSGHGTFVAYGKAGDAVWRAPR